MLSALLLVACRRPPEAPTQLNDLAGYLFEHFEDEDQAEMAAGITNLRAWLGQRNRAEDAKEGESNLDATLDGYSVDNLAESVLDSVNPDREHDMEHLGGASVAYVSENRTAEIGEVLLLEEQEDVFPKAYLSHDREYLTDETCFMSHGCDFVDTDNVVEASYVILKVNTHSRAQYRWVEFEDGQYAFLHRTWLVDEAEASPNLAQINEQLYVGVTMPWKGGSVRIGTTWISAVILDGAISEGTALNLMVDSMSSEGEKLDDYIETGGEK